MAKIRTEITNDILETVFGGAIIEDIEFRLDDLIEMVKARIGAPQRTLFLAKVPVTPPGENTGLRPVKDHFDAA